MLLQILQKKTLCRLWLLSQALFFSIPTMAQQFTDRIKINQLGFYPNAPKVAIIAGDGYAASAFYITSTNLRDTFLIGELPASTKGSAYSKTITRLIDFSLLTKEGSYVVLVPGLGHSHVFKIGNDIFAEASTATLKGFYYQRSSMSLEPKYAGKWHRSAGHPDTVVYVHPSAATAKRPAGTIISSPYGWYDAGDYNKYIVNSGITMGTLLSAFENYPAYFKKLKANIPES
ncbi:MAG: cellulase, partial [Chitinophagaceae bacterium]